VDCCDHRSSPSLLDELLRQDKRGSVDPPPAQQGKGGYSTRLIDQATATFRDAKRVITNKWTLRRPRRFQPDPLQRPPKRALAPLITRFRPVLETCPYPCGIWRPAQPNERTARAPAAPHGACWGVLLRPEPFSRAASRCAMNSNHRFSVQAERPTADEVGVSARESPPSAEKTPGRANNEIQVSLGNLPSIHAG
jgi:hypothetical protein